MQWCWDIAEVVRDNDTAHRYVLSVIDMHSKFAWHFPLHTETAAEVGFYLLHLCHAEGHPEKGLTDNGGHFTSVEAQRTLTAMGLKIAHGKPYKPTTQGADERLHQTIANSVLSIYLVWLSTNVSQLRHAANVHGGTWAHLVDIVNHQYNCRFHSSIGMSPYEAHRGEKPRVMGYTGGTIELDPEAAQQSMADRAKEIQQSVHAKLIERGIMMFNRHASKHNIQIQEIAVNTVVRMRSEAPRTVAQWRVVGFVVKQYPGEYCYDVRLLNDGYLADEVTGTMLKRVPHRNLLPLRHTVDEAKQMLLRHNEEEEQEERHTATNERLVYEVEMVVAKKHHEEHGFLYWVKWKRHPWTASTFEPLYVRMQHTCRSRHRSYALRSDNFTPDVAQVLPHLQLETVQQAWNKNQLRELDRMFHACGF